MSTIISNVAGIQQNFWASCATKGETYHGQANVIVQNSLGFEASFILLHCNANDAIEIACWANIAPGATTPPAQTVVGKYNDYWKLIAYPVKKGAPVLSMDYTSGYNLWYQFNYEKSDAGQTTTLVASPGNVSINMGSGRHDTDNMVESISPLGVHQTVVTITNGTGATLDVFAFLNVFGSNLDTFAGCLALAPGATTTAVTLPLAQNAEYSYLMFLAYDRAAGTCYTLDRSNSQSIADIANQAPDNLNLVVTNSKLQVVAGSSTQSLDLYPKHCAITAEGFPDL